MKNLSFLTHYGVDLTGEDTKRHFAALQNMRRRPLGDKRGTDAPAPDGSRDVLETVPGFRRLLTAGGAVHTLLPAPHEKAIYVHAGKRLYRLSLDALPSLPSGDTASPLSAMRAAREKSAPAVPVTMAVTDASGKDAALEEFLPDRPIGFTAFGACLYLLTGEHLFCLDRGEISLVGTIKNNKIGTYTAKKRIEPYVPLIAENGLPSEQRNILTDRFREEYRLTEAMLSNEGNAPLVFKVTSEDADNPTCRVEGLLPFTGDLLIVPSSTVVDGLACTVTEIAPHALTGGTFTELMLPHTLRSIDPPPYGDCPSVHTVHLPLGLHEVYMSAFNGFSPTLTVKYEGRGEDWDAMSVYDDTYLGEYTIRFVDYFPYGTAGIPLALPAKRLLECTLNGEDLLYNASLDAVHMYEWRENGNFDTPVTRLILRFRTRRDLIGKTLKIKAEATPHVYESEGGHHPLATEEGTSSASLIYACRMLSHFDNRLFFGGCPTAPDTLFFSHEDKTGSPIPHYIGTLNYQTDGERMPLCGLETAGGDLFAWHTDGVRGRLTVHRPTLPPEAVNLFIRLYPPALTLESGVPRAPLFIYEGCPHLPTSEGVSVLRQTANGSYTVSSVASRIRPVLSAYKGRLGGGVCPPVLSGRLDGNLVLSMGDEVYLGDSAVSTRFDGRREYEWYPLKGIAVHEGDAPAYRTQTEIPACLAGAYGMGADGALFTPSAAARAEDCAEGELTTSPVYRKGESGSIEASDGTLYTLKKQTAAGDLYLLADLTGAYTGGKESPLSCMGTLDGLLFFGTASGAVCLFNTDGGGGDASTSYLFDGHRPLALAETYPTDCGVANYMKRTVAGSGVCLLTAMEGSRPTLLCMGDGKRFFEAPLPAAPLDFGALDFGNLSFGGEGAIACPLPEVTRPFRRKAYLLLSDTPFGFRGLAFSYNISGTVRE